MEENDSKSNGSEVQVVAKNDGFGVKVGVAVGNGGAGGAHGKVALWWFNWIRQCCWDASGKGSVIVVQFQKVVLL